MDARSKQVLFAVTQSYINAATPVGSRQISKNYKLGISSATIRNTMADLEEMGYLNQPHTSSGRIPTDRGYRYYVDELLGLRKLNFDNNLLGTLCDNLVDLKGDLNDFLLMVTKTLSIYSNYMTITLSASSKCGLKRIEFFSYKNNKVIALILTGDGFIKHRIIETDTILTQDELDKISHYIDTEFAGRTLAEIRRTLVEDVTRERLERNDMISRALKLCKTAVTFSKEFSIDLFISGLTEMLEHPDFSDVQKIKDLSKTIENKSMIINLLEKLIVNEGVQVCVGNESCLNNDSLSLVASRFYEKGNPLGVFGIIGPKRMDYISAISMVDTTVSFLTDHIDSI